MFLKTIIYSWQRQIVIGIIVGLTISIIDNYAFEGEVNPIVIILLLLAVSGFSGLLFGWPGWFTVFVMWLFVPAAHIIKYIFGLTDTIYPDTLNSIFKLAIFTFTVTAAGFASGVLLRRFINSNSSNMRSE
jgi:hypothetical protein